MFKIKNFAAVTAYLLTLQLVASHLSNSSINFGPFNVLLAAGVGAFCGKIDKEVTMKSFFSLVILTIVAMFFAHEFGFFNNPESNYKDNLTSKFEALSVIDSGKSSHDDEHANNEGVNSGSILKELHTNNQPGIENGVYSDISLSEKETYEAKIIMDDLVNMSEKAKIKDWQGFTDVIEEASIIEPESLNYALFQALVFEAPLELIKELLNKGAFFTPESLSVLAIKDNVSLLKSLIPLGLDIHMVSKDFNNSISYSLKVNASRSVFDFLIDSGVDVQVNGSYTDSLMYALKLCSQTVECEYYVKSLRKKGAVFKSQHLELLNDIRLTDSKLYSNLIEG
ncbi:hypothetical protein [Bowmanella yangjiangensis]|uniref:Ankyrin repeat domain-containing protein n=1 Tax=Bowmanella yangjiangensis TaxID=2811230 RepID=A0ABS3CUI5_9ALTE|nr:hypothetical protein [Bowmanella yangjiangensis]MBN7820782.1 hypothetical protein [Bowmanella yangjiangensis]